MLDVEGMTQIHWSVQELGIYNIYLQCTMLVRFISILSAFQFLILES